MLTTPFRFPRQGHVRLSAEMRSSMDAVSFISKPRAGTREFENGDPTKGVVAGSGERQRSE